LQHVFQRELQREPQSEPQNELKRRARPLWAALISTLALAVPHAVSADVEIDRTLEMPADGLVFVENVAGTVEFIAWDRPEVQIRGEAGDTVEEVEISSTSKGVQVRVINHKGGHRIDGTELYLRIPASASVEAETVSADISVGGSRGDTVILRTVSGDLQVEASPKRIELASVSGDVEFEGDVARSSIETVSGEIVIVGAAGEVSASTVSGDVSLEGGEVSLGRFEAVSGNLILSLSLADAGRLACDSMSGDVNLSLPSTQQAEFTAQSFSGSIRTDFGKSARVSHGPGVVLEHREGDNGAKIRLESFSGDISIRSH
jgi:DUF4097 and DUF4098 domain-containing protein YvlB